LSNGSELKGRSAEALRNAGFLPLPRLWVRAEDLDLITYMASQYANEVNKIRREATGGKQAEIEIAWSRYRK
jgi:hypothetical protein